MGLSRVQFVLLPSVDTDRGSSQPFPVNLISLSLTDYFVDKEISEANGQARYALIPNFLSWVHRRGCATKTSTNPHVQTVLHHPIPLKSILQLMSFFLTTRTVAATTAWALKTLALFFIFAFELLFSRLPLKGCGKYQVYTSLKVRFGPYWASLSALLGP